MKKMKPKNEFFDRKFDFVIMISIVSTFLYSCDSQSENVLPITPELMEAKAVSVKQPIMLKGKSIFEVYAIKEQKLIVDPEIFQLDVDATLNPIKGHHYTLETTEKMGDTPFRISLFDVHMSSGGALKFHWADQVPIIEEHTGYDLRGPGINEGGLDFKGHFDGERLFAQTQQMAHQIKPGTVSMPDYVTMVEGPIRFKVSFDLYIQ